MPRQKKAWELLGNWKPKDRMVHFPKAEALVNRDDERKLLISGLQQVHSQESLELAAKYLDNDTLKNEAEAAGIAIMWELRRNRTDAAEAIMLVAAREET